MPMILSRPKQHGFTLIEVLVTLIIVAVGLLGLAGLQVTGLRNNLSSESRSQATLMANDIIERMRANPVGVANNDYAAIDTAALDCGADARPVPFCSNFNTGAANAAADCTPAEIATFDAWVWYCGMPVEDGVRGGGIRNWLTNGSATVSCAACAPGSPHTVTVNWDEVSSNRAVGADGPVTQTVTIVAVP